MSNLVIVAIPDENDRVWKVSSEKKPHLTLLFLGDADEVSNVDQIVKFVEHAANTSLNRFYLPVDRRGELGEDQADVLFFKKGRYDYKAIRDFRVQLLKDNNIRTAYDSATQFEGPWNPHLTLGYPAQPAKPEKDDYGNFYDVSFNKIAVWMGDYEGPEFLLEDPWDKWETMEAAPVDVAMSSLEAGDAYILEHYGVKGMKWGVRRDLHGEEGKRSGIQGYIDPQGHSLGKDIAISAVTSVIPVLAPLGIPANIRLNRGAYRGAKAFVQSRGEKRQDKKIAKEDAKFEKAKDSAQTFAAIHNGAVPRMNKDLEGINKRYEGVDLNRDHGKRKEYHDEVEKSMRAAYTESANKLGNRRGTKHLDLEFQPDGSFKIKVKDGMQKPSTEEEARHAAIDDDDTVTFAGKFLRNKTGHILAFDFEDFDNDLPVPSEMAQSAEDGAEYMVFNGMMDPDYFLEHFGVKGMKWGVRKEDVKSVGRAAKSAGGAVGKAAKATSTFVRDVNFESKTEAGTDANQKLRQEIHGKAKEALKRTDLPAIKAKPEYQKAKKLPNRLRHPFDPTTKAYRKEVKEAYIKRLEDAANSMTNASGTRQYTVRERGWELPAEGGALPTSKYYWGVTSREIKHAADEFTTWHELVMDADGFITDIKDLSEEPTDPTASHSLQAGAAFIIGLGIADDDLLHYGVKGMRWGVRRRGDPIPMEPTATSRVPHGAKRKTQIEVTGGHNHEAHPDALLNAERKAKLKKSGPAALSNKELQEMAKRMQLEQQVGELSQSKSKKFISGFLKNQGQQTAGAAVQYGRRQKLGF